MSFATALTELNDSVGDYFGEEVDYLSYAGVDVNDITGVVVDYQDEQGVAMVDIPIASVASPGFGDKLTLADASVWRIYEYGNAKWEYTPCELRSESYWKTVDIEYMRTDTEVWADLASHTGVIAHIAPSSSQEVISAEDGRAVTTYEVRTVYLATPTVGMRFEYGSKNLYITGIRHDPSFSRWTIFDVAEEEA